MVQVLAQATGRRLRPISTGVILEMVAAMQSNPDALDQPRKHLEAIKRILDREAPDYKQ